jgi:hypothetical protein
MRNPWRLWTSSLDYRRRRPTKCGRPQAARRATRDYLPMRGDAFVSFEPLRLCVRPFFGRCDRRRFSRRERRGAAAVSRSPRWALAGNSPRAATHVSGECSSSHCCATLVSVRFREGEASQAGVAAKLRPPEICAVNDAAAIRLQRFGLRSNSSTSPNCWTSLNWS